MHTGSFPASILVLALAMGSAHAATGVATGGVNVRDQPGLNSNIIGQLAPGQQVEVAKCVGAWCLTEVGFVSASYLAILDGDAGFDEEGEYADDEEDFADEDAPGAKPTIGLSFNFGHPW